MQIKQVLALQDIKNYSGLSHTLFSYYTKIVFYTYYTVFLKSGHIIRFWVLFEFCLSCLFCTPKPLTGPTFISATTSSISSAAAVHAFTPTLEFHLMKCSRMREAPPRNAPPQYLHSNSEFCPLCPLITAWSHLGGGNICV